MALVGGKIQIRTIYHLQKMFLTTNVIFKYLYLILAFLVQFITIFYFYFHFIPYVFIKTQRQFLTAAPILSTNYSFIVPTIKLLLHQLLIITSEGRFWHSLTNWAHCCKR